jgi:hypothetical protein
MEVTMRLRHPPTILPLLLFSLLALAPAVQGQTQIIRQVIGSGASAMAGDHLLAGTIGQTIIGRSSSSGNIGYLGFWFTYPNPNNPNSVREEYSNAVTGVAARVSVAPNPVVDVATVSVVLPASGQVQLGVYDGLGQQRLELINGWREAGTVTVQLPARQLESGDYLLVLIAGGTRSASQMRVIK